MKLNARGMLYPSIPDIASIRDYPGRFPYFVQSANIALPSLPEGATHWTVNGKRVPNSEPTLTRWESIRQSSSKFFHWLFQN